MSLPVGNLGFYYADLTFIAFGLREQISVCLTRLTEDIQDNEVIQMRNFMEFESSCYRHASLQMHYTFSVSV